MKDETLNKAKVLVKKLDKVIANTNKKIKLHSSKAQGFLEQKNAVHAHNIKIKGFIGKVKPEHVKKIHAHSSKLTQVQQNLHQHHASYTDLAEKYKKHLAVFKSAKTNLLRQMKNVTAGKYSAAELKKFDAWLDEALTKLSAIPD